MLPMNGEANGQRSQDTQGEQGWQEGSKGLYLQQPSGATDGSTHGEEGRSLIINIENARDAKAFVAHNLKTTEEVRTEIFARYPALNDEKLTLQIFAGRQGSKRREPLEGLLPALEEVWVTIYLRKH
jgi:hypothetical protein